MGQTVHSMVIEIDRVLKLNLSNGRFEKLADMILKHEDSNNYAIELMTWTSIKVLVVINDYVLVSGL